MPRECNRRRTQDLHVHQNGDDSEHRALCGNYTKVTEPISRGAKAFGESDSEAEVVVDAGRASGQTQCSFSQKMTNTSCSGN